MAPAPILCLRLPEHAIILIGMISSRLAFPCVAALSLSATLVATPGATEIPEPQAPSISETHRRFLSRVVRRTIGDAAGDRGTYEPGYVPDALASLKLEVIVRLRHRGYLVATGMSGPAPVASATRDAAHEAVRALLQEGSLDRSRFHQLLVELEVIGPALSVPTDGDWTQPRAIDRFIEPGVHGMVVRGPRGRHRFLPTDIFTSDLVVSEAATRLAQQTHGGTSQLPGAKLMRFRTAHWIQPSADATIVSLQRGLTLIPPTMVCAQGLDDAIARLAEYMVYRQKESGLFSYQYEPGLDIYSERDNVVRQIGATLAMAAHARWSGKSASLAAADIAIRYHLNDLKDIPDVENGAFIATMDKKNKLGVTALMSIALANHPKAQQYAQVRGKLVNGMLWLQRPSGMFITAFPPAVQISAQDYFPGEALLALAREYEQAPSGRILDAFARAIDFYRGYFRDRPMPAFVPWQVQAYALMARSSKRRDYVDFVFELTDWLAKKQLNESNCPWPRMWGGIASYQPGRAGVSTAAYLEAFTDALMLARVVDDAERVRRYEALVRGAARFVMQLQVRPVEAYFIRSPLDAVGGIRTTPTLNLLRIDHCQHALVALMKTRQVLYP